MITRLVSIIIITLIINLLSNAHDSNSVGSEDFDIDGKMETAVWKMQKPHAEMLPVDESNPFGSLFRFSKTSRPSVRIPARLSQFHFPFRKNLLLKSQLNNSLTNIYIKGCLFKQLDMQPPCIYYVFALREIII